LIVKLEFVLMPDFSTPHLTGISECEKLYGRRTGRAKEELLLPLCADIFYRKAGWRGEKVFDRDARGRVARMLDRRGNNDLVWKKVK
jgi:hypothetical protein